MKMKDFFSQFPRNLLSLGLLVSIQILNMAGTRREIIYGGNHVYFIFMLTNFVTWCVYAALAEMSALVLLGFLP